MNLLLRATRALLLVAVLIGGTLLASGTHAAPGVRANVTYQARLMDASGYPVADGTYQVRFSLYDSAVAGTRLWTASGTTAVPTTVDVSVQDGLFTVLLGDGVTQLPFNNINWNSDSLYLGVTIGADGEMSPRRPITAVPQAINSAQLSGMSASGTDTYGGESQFTITQASTTAATSTRSALDVRSNGTSLTNDFILRAITNTGAPVFTITSQGVVSTTNLLVSGQNVCLADGSNCIPASEFDTLATVTARGSTTTVPLTFFGGITASSLSVTGTSQVGNLIGTNATFTAVTSTILQASLGQFSSAETSGLTFGAATGVLLSLNSATTTNFSWARAIGNDLVVLNATFTEATTTSLAASLVSSTQLFVAGKNVCLQDGTNCQAFPGESDTLASVTGRGASTTVAVTFFGGVTSSNLNVSGTANLANVNASSVAVSGGLSAATGSITGFMWSNATGTNTTGTNAYFVKLNSDDLSATNLIATAATFTQATATLVYTQVLTATDAGITNATATNLIFTNASGVNLALSGVLTATNASITNATTTNSSVTNLVFAGATGTSVDVISVSTTNLLVSGTLVCLQDGTNCSSATTTLQAAYNNGRLLTLNNGKIDVQGVIGGPDQFTYQGLNVTPIFGASDNAVTSTGFDLSIYHNGATGTLFTFTDNRLDPGATVNTSYLLHFPEFDNSLVIGNATSYIQTDNDIVDLVSAGNEILMNLGRIEFTANSDISGTTPFSFFDNGTESSILRLSNNNGTNNVHIGTDANPNGSYNPIATSDLLIRSGSTGGSGTQLYVNVDGTNTGWRGVATTDMLADAPMTLMSQNYILPGDYRHIDVEGNIAAITFKNGDWGLYDISRPEDQREIYYDTTPTSYMKMVGSRLYKADLDGFIRVYDISEPANPNILGSYDTTDGAISTAELAIEGSELYYGSVNLILTLDVKDPTAIVLDDAVPTPGFDYAHIAVQNGFLYYSYKAFPSTDVNVVVFDYRDPTVTNFYDGLTIAGASAPVDDSEIRVSGRELYLKPHSGGQSDVVVYDLDNGFIGSQIDSFSSQGEFIDHFEVVDGRVYIASFFADSTQNIFESWVKSANGNFTLEEVLGNGIHTTNAFDAGRTFDIQGSYVYGYGFNAGDFYINIIDLGGKITRNLRASTASIGNLSVADDLHVRGAANFENAVTVMGRGVCLSDGTGCQAGAAAGSLQAAYLGDRTIATMPNGHIELNGQTGSPTDITHNGNQYTRFIGGGLSDNATTTGFDIAMAEFSANDRSVAMLFSNNRDNPDDPGALTSSLEYYSDDGNYQYLGLNSGVGYVFADTYGAELGSGPNYLNMGSSTVMANDDGLFQVRNYTGNYTGMSLFNNLNNNTVKLLTGTDDPNGNATGSIGDVFYRGGNNGSGTQMYLNTDGSNTGWRGVVTNDIIGYSPASRQSGSYTFSEPNVNALDLQVTGTIGIVSIEYVPGPLLYAWKTLDLSDPFNPVVLYEDPGASSVIVSLQVDGTTLYVVRKDANTTLESWDISNPAVPALLDTLSLGASAYQYNWAATRISGTKLYTATDGILSIVDVSNPAALSLDSQLPGFTTHYGNRNDLVVDGNYVYYAGNPNPSNGELDVIDVSNPLAPSFVTSIVNPDFGINPYLKLVGSSLYWQSNGFVTVIDVSNPLAPFIDSATVPAGLVSTLAGFVINGSDLYASDNTSVHKYSVADLSTSLDSFTVGEGVRSEFIVGSALVGLNQTRLVAYGLTVSPAVRHFGSNASWDATFVNVSATAVTVGGINVCLQNGANCPTNSDVIMSRYALSDAIDKPLFVDVEGRLAFVVDKFNWNLHDLSDPAAPQLAYTEANPMRTGRIYGNRLYTLEDGADILHAYDISNPSAPVALGTFNTGSSTADMAEISVVGSNVVLATADGLYVIDAKNPASMSLLSFTSLNRAYPRLAVQDGFAYYSSKPGYGLLDTTTTVSVFDIRNPAAVTLATSFDVTGRNKPDNEIAISDRRLFVNGKATSGDQINVYNVANPASPAFVSSTHMTAETPDHFVVVRGRLYAATFDADSTQSNFESWTINADGSLTHEQTLNPGIQTTNSTDHPVIFDIDGNYAFGWGLNLGTDYLASINLGGVSSRSFAAATADFGQLSIGNGLSVRGQSNFAGFVTVNGVGVCLADGTNCPSMGGSSDWTYSTALDLLKPASSTADVLMGSADTSTAGAPFFLQTNSVGTSTMFFGFGTSTDVVIGTSTRTPGGVHPAFSMNGDDLFVAGNIGTATSVFAAGGFIAGTGTTQYLDGRINTVSSDLILSPGSNVIRGLSNNAISLGSATTSFKDLYTSGTQYFVNATGARLDVMASSTINTVSSFTTTYGYGGTLFGDYLITTNGTDFAVNDISDPKRIRTVGTVTPDVSANTLAMSGKYGYAIVGASMFSSTELAVIDFTNPAAPATVNTFFPISTTNLISVQVEGNKLYVGRDSLTGGFVNIYDITNPVSPTLVTSTKLTTFTYNSFKVKDGFLYLKNYEGSNYELKIFDVRSPQTTALISTTTITGGCTANRDLVFHGAYVYFDCDNSLNVIDVSNIASPVVVTSTALSIGGAMAIDGSTLYVQNNSNYISAYDITSSTNPVLFASYFKAGTTNFVANGKYGYVMTPTAISAVDLPGIQTRTLDAGGATLGTLSVEGDGHVYGSLDVADGLIIGDGGIMTFGSFTSAATGTTSTFMGIVSSTRMTAGSLFIGQSSAYSQNNFAGVISYASSSSFGGLCIDDVNTGATCPTSVGASIMADGAITANAFDLAEMYAASGTVTPGDLVMFSDGATSTVEVTRGMAYDPRAIGVISTRPGFVLGWEGGAQVALTGRVPVKVTVANGVIRVGDKLTSSNVTGTAMKSTRAGMTVGVALQDTDTDGVIEMFVQPEFDLSTSINPDGSVQLVNANGSTTLSIDTNGNAYFLGDVSATSFTTHAAFDLAERYTSPDQLEAGDLVMINPNAEMQMVRTVDEKSVAIGIVSSAPGFTLGANASGTYAVALAGRVPTKVSAINGEIKRGDAIAASSIPGVAAKATTAGQIIGYALQEYSGADNGLIEVFIQPGLWIPKDKLESLGSASTSTSNGTGAARQGFAKIVSGGSRVHVAYSSINSYPVPQVTAMGHVSGGWWLENVSDTGFDIVMDTVQPIDVQFSWQVSPSQTGIMQYSSDGTYGQLDPLTGQLVVSPDPTPTPDPAPVPDPAPADTTTTTP